MNKSYVVRFDVIAEAESAAEAAGEAMRLLQDPRFYPLAVEVAEDEPEQDLSGALQCAEMFNLHADGAATSADEHADTNTPSSLDLGAIAESILGAGIPKGGGL